MKSKILNFINTFIINMIIIGGAMLIKFHNYGVTF
jgi:hypothetical protein